MPSGATAPPRHLRASIALAAALLAPAAPAAAADLVPSPPVPSPPPAETATPALASFLSLPPFPGPNVGPVLRIGAYGGEITTGAFYQNLFEPWTVKLRDSYIVDVHAIYTAYRFTSLPLDLEVEGGVAHRFGIDHQAEVDLIPMARWKWLPWNNLVYTNVRLGLLGASYVDGVSPTELRRSGTDHGSRYLNFLVPEVTFSSGPEAPWEVFVRIHHRSGIYGLIDGVNGGSNYVSVGARFGVF